MLADQQLTGLLLGQTLHTSRSEIYRALIEATAFGARAIIERFREYGVPIERIVCSGGIAEKNPMLMQIYADVTDCEMLVSRSSQSCALGAAIGAAVISGAHPDFPTAQAAITGLKDISYLPEPAAKTVYNDLYQLYSTLHDAFGDVTGSANLAPVMNRLLGKSRLVDLTFGSVSIADPERKAFAIKALSLDPQAPPAPQNLIDKHFLRKHGPDAYYGQSSK